MTPRPELRPAVERVLDRYTTRMGAVNLVALADELTAREAELDALERQWQQLVAPAALEAAARAHYQMASAFSWDRLSTAEQALARTAALAAIVAAKKTARRSRAAAEDAADA